MTAGHDYYGILGVTRKATAAEIRQAYRKKVREWHPDRHQDSPESQEQMRIINEAHDVLSNPQTRATYDLLGVAPGATSGGKEYSRQELATLLNHHLQQNQDLMLHNFVYGGVKGVLLVIAAVVFLVSSWGPWAVIFAFLTGMALFRSSKTWVKIFLRKPEE